MVKWLTKQSGIQALEPSGPLPSQMGCKQWKQSWVTLYLEWKVDYAPTKKNVSGADDSMAGWSMGEVEYSFTGAVPKSTVSQSGRNILTPHSTLQLKNSLETYLEAHTDEKLKDILTKILNLSVVSQRLGGLNLRFLSKQQVMQLPLMTKSKQEKDKNFTAKVKSRLEHIEFLPEMASTRFLPIRAGFLKVNKISVCSSFGQRQELISHIDDIIFSEHLPVKDSKWGEVPPRLAQGGRLSLNFISSSNNGIRSGLPADTSPICGYLVPDNLNLNLFVFDAEGVWLGMLRGIYENNKVLGAWMNAPGKTKSDFKNEHLKGFVEGIEHYKGKQDPAFGALLQLLEQRFSHTLSKETGDTLASLWGRPIALVRASLDMQLLGKPAYSMARTHFGKYETDKFEKISYPVLVGDAARMQDGVIGYFCDTNSEKGYLGYDKLICAAHTNKPKIDTAYLEYDKKATLSPGDIEPTYISLLVEPGARVSVRSCILPAAYENLLPEHFQTVMSKLYLSLESNPIITELPNSSEVFIPVPKESDGQWSWSHLNPQGQFIERSAILPPEASFHGSNPCVVDGYLIRKFPE